MTRMTRGEVKRIVKQREASVKIPRPLVSSEHGLFFGLLKREGLPLPKTEFAFAAPLRRWRFDFAWPHVSDIVHDYRNVRVAVEVEGGIWSKGGGRHNRGKGMLADMEKYNEAAVMGWKVIRVTPNQLCTLETIDLIKRALNQ
jgi:hypothetical protein